MHYGAVGMAATGGSKPTKHCNYPLLMRCRSLIGTNLTRITFQHHRNIHQHTYIQNCN
ncbi:hypothetical protein lpa_02805 [Legionella pneumophila 2300/99 Alcoy]|nr:hypothetical protein lpa_02805 [Legionella pneumophila 2300/99 Alcoy]